MSDPSLILQGAVVAALKGATAVANLVGGRVYDQPPPSPVFPYITLGEDQVLIEQADCYEGSETTLTVHAWSDAVGFPQVKAIAGAVRTSLQSAALNLTGERLIGLDFVDARYLREPDGLVSHAVLTFRALTEPI